MTQKNTTGIREYNTTAIEKINKLIVNTEQSEDTTEINVTLKFNDFSSIGFALDGIFTAIETIVENDHLQNTAFSILELSKLGRGITENLPLEFLDVLLIKKNNKALNPNFEPIEKSLTK